MTEIMNLKKDSQLGPYVGNIAFNTAYYVGQGQAGDPNAVALLQQMAGAGNGLYMSLSGSQQIYYQQFSPAQTPIQNQVVDVYIENKNATWWQGQLMQDSDGDGIPDAIELQLGSNPNAADSDGNGVSDLVEYKTKGVPCKATGCSQAGRDSFSICAGFSPSVDSNNNVTFAASTNDGLNDCEKYILGASSRVISSPGDMIPDYLALKAGISVLPGNPTVAQATPYADGFTDYQKLKLGLPIGLSAQDNLLNNFVTRTQSLTVSSTPDPQTLCYNLTASNISATAADNTMKVYLIQNSSVIQDNAFLRTAEGRLNNMSVSFQPSDFH